MIPDDGHNDDLIHKLIAEINEEYLRVQDFVDPTLDALVLMLRQGQVNENFAAKCERAQHTYKINLETLRTILPQLLPKEIGEAYVEGCRLLQRNLSGHMLTYWDDMYVPVLEYGVKNRHGHTGWMFLQKLADHNIAAYEDLVIDCLDNAGFQETALSIIRRYKLTQALDKIKPIVDSHESQLSQYATEVLKDISS